MGGESEKEPVMLAKRTKKLDLLLIGRNVAFLFAILLLAGCSQDVPPINCSVPDIKCFIDQATRGIIVVRENVSYWSNVNLIAQVMVAVSGTVATVMIALQGDQNKVWTRPVGLVATALVTGLTSALVSFHVPDNIDKLIDTMQNMAIVTNEFDYKTTKLVDGKSQKDIEDMFKTDKEFRESLSDLSMKFTTDFNNVKIGMLKMSGSAGKLNSVSPAIPSSNTSPSKGAPTGH